MMMIDEPIKGCMDQYINSEYTGERIKDDDIVLQVQRLKPTNKSSYIQLYLSDSIHLFTSLYRIKKKHDDDDYDVYDDDNLLPPKCNELIRIKSLTLTKEKHIVIKEFESLGILSTLIGRPKLHMVYQPLVQRYITVRNLQKYSQPKPSSVSEDHDKQYGITSLKDLKEGVSDYHLTVCVLVRMKSELREGPRGSVFTLELVDTKTHDCVPAVSFSQEIPSNYTAIHPGFPRNNNSKFQLVIDKTAKVLEVPPQQRLHQDAWTKFNFINIDQLGPTAIPIETVNRDSILVDVIGKILSISDISSIELRNGGIVPTLLVNIFDTSNTSIDITFWGEHALSCQQQLKVGDIITLYQVKLTNYSGRSLSFATSRLDINPSNFPQYQQLLAFINHPTTIESKILEPKNLSSNKSPDKADMHPPITAKYLLSNPNFEDYKEGATNIYVLNDETGSVNISIIGYSESKVFGPNVQQDNNTTSSLRMMIKKERPSDGEHHQISGPALNFSIVGENLKLYVHNINTLGL
ncbi:hypothetical protein DFA_11250 [Cavenderia fasciculata]|uniref:Replication protein A OB domain-containing protein n=1 Tax=Cavenderia fasciculata TaxID=261658 RepID=F4QFN6_CACFS|nr:uncharacterized protein DFA_11250 [Cavenderia fasciculata]EGG13489.1 hypothetical protein DFA_11250 [Cavenderia fasciculata]|eukprot:XP_004350193.1 hypothetical protein DFA_11250 [Cavenderia fasciculata]